MNMLPDRLRRAAALTLLAAGLVWTLGCAARQADRAAPLNHIVLFQLTDPADAEALIADSRTELGQIPGVRSLFAGTPFETGRAGVDSSYDACLCIGFESADDYAAYLEHPNHTGLVARWKSRFARTTIYDVRDAALDREVGTPAR